MDAKLKQRLVGAAVIAALIFIALAVLLKNNNSAQQQESVAAKSPAIALAQATNNDATANPQTPNNQENLADNNSAEVPAPSNNIPSPDNITAANSSNNQATQATIPNNAVSNNNVENTALNNQPIANPSPNAAKAIANDNTIVNNENVAPPTTNTTPPLSTPITNSANNPNNKTVSNTGQNQVALNQTTPDQVAATPNVSTNSTVAAPQITPITPPTNLQTHKTKIRSVVVTTPSVAVAIPAHNAKKNTPALAVNTTLKGKKVWAVQVGSFKEASNVEALSKRLNAHHFTTYTITFNTSNGLRTHLYVGAKLLDKNAAEILVAKLQKTMNINAILVSATTTVTHAKKISVVQKKSSPVSEGLNSNV